MEGLAVAKAGQRIAVSEVMQVALLGGALRHIAQNAAIAGELAIECMDQRNASLEVSQAAVGTAQLHIEAGETAAVTGQEECGLCRLDPFGLQQAGEVHPLQLLQAIT